MNENGTRKPTKNLDRYKKKRDPQRTNEPFEAEPTRSAGATRRGRFVVHCHDARNRHYDLRIQVGGVLESFAVPRGPSLDPTQKRLAVQTEPHPLRYLTFEGVIPDGNYGAGPMIVWDTGRVRYLKQSVQQGLQDGSISMELEGFKLKGRFSLVRVKGKDADDKTQWLLMKREDAYAEPDSDVIESRPWSVMSGLSVEERPQAEARYRAILDALEASGVEQQVVRASEITPMLCKAADEPNLDRDDSLYELKLDGARILAERKESEVRLFYRTHRPATANFPEIVEAMRTLLAKRVVLDGEIVAFDAQGRPSFQSLSSRLHTHRAQDVHFLREAIPVHYIVFDVLSVGDFDLRSRPLSERKRVLHEVLPKGGLIRTLDYVLANGKPLMAFCEQHELEGIVAKRTDATYVEGPARSGAWTKFKRTREDDFVVVGYRYGQGSRKRLGALELAVWLKGTLTLVGRVGSGLSESFIDALLVAMTGLEVDACPAEGKLESAPEGRVFVEPQIVVRVRYNGWAGEGHRLRHPVFVGIRDDIPVESVTLEPKAEDATSQFDAQIQIDKGERKVGNVLLSNQDKVFWPEDGISKGDLCSYYESVAEVLLPHLAERPVTLVRFPDGIDGVSFFQWRIPSHAPPWLRSLLLTKKKKKEKRKDTHTILIDSVDALLYVANSGCIPLHMFAARSDSLDVCDFLTFDLDVEFSTLREAVPIAITLRDILKEIGLASFPKTSGKTGLHVLVPLGAGLPFDAAKQLLELVGRLALQKHPETATMERRKDQRGARVFIDIGQTGLHRTIVAPYSVRATPGALVSTPLDWEEVSLSLDPSAYDLFTVPRRLVHIQDPMANAWSQTIDFARTLAKLSDLVDPS